MAQAAALESHSHGHGLSEAAIERSKFGMWLFLASEVMFFGGFIGAFIVLKAMNPDLFHASAQQLNWRLALLNTAVLITSSLTMALAVHAAQQGDRRKTAGLLAATIVLAFGFLAIKYIEYSAKLSHDPPIAPATNIFFGCYYLLTGFHALHVIAGIISLFFILGFALAGKYGPHNYAGVELTGLYWHLVDVVWIFLFPMLYLMP